jgi:predicted phosphoribosyltransferase
VVLASAIAKALDLPLDVLIARKIGAPGNPEMAIGAIAEDGAPYEVKRLLAEAAAQGRAFRPVAPAHSDQDAHLSQVD